MSTLEHAIVVANRVISKESQKNPCKAIRAKCIDCCGAEDYERRIRECEIPNCAIYPFRMGKNPFRKGKPMTEEQKEKMKKGRSRNTDSSE